MIDNTRIKYIRSKSLDNIILFVNSLPYKIEIKGNPVSKGRYWFLFFVLPETESIKDFPSGNID